jgi:glycosyltransferase involved in cell wall biosynthesis
MKKPSLCFIDIIGLTYDDTTIDKYGLGGSESAIVYMAREMTALGFEVTVFNNCIDSRSTPGMFNGVMYRDLQELHQPNRFQFDVMVASRSVIPFVPPDHANDFNYPTQIFQRIRDEAKLKILWLHDTFCSGDHLVEEYVTRGYIDQVFTLSDFHTSYFTNCNHGRPRNFEVLKKKIFQTRNGVRLYRDYVDVTQKDPNLYVYNASVSKGMVPLVTAVWPAVKKRLPDARLKIVGGYYRFRDNAPKDEQELTYWNMVKIAEQDPTLGIEFTGIIPQRQIADILTEAAFTIYPAAFPETFGISTLESLSYNTPILTCRFGALEETAIEHSSYLLDYAITPNSLFPEIHQGAQVERFVEMVVEAAHNPYVAYQKRNHCNVIKGWCGWDGVALQWKQQIFRSVGWFLPKDEFRRVDALNHQVHRVFGRRFSNPVEWSPPSEHTHKQIVVISPFFNAKDFLPMCMTSVATQDYPTEKVRHILVDDHSTDTSGQVVSDYAAQYPNIEGFRPPQRHGALANQLSALGMLLEQYQGRENEVVVALVDGDDWLYPDNTIFTQINNIYHDDVVDMTYGSMWSCADIIPLIAQPFHPATLASGQFRGEQFPWKIPYTHLRTFRLSVVKNILNDLSQFTDEQGDIYRAGGDGALQYYLLEHSRPTGIRAIQDIWYVYNDMNPLNDYKVNANEQNRNSTHIQTRKWPTF